VRVGLALPGAQTTEWAVRADAAGLAAVLLPDAPGGAAPVAAAVAAVTRDVRILVPVLLGSEHPVTLAEEIAVVDQISGGRVIAVVDSTSLTGEQLAEDLALLRASLSGRAFAHTGVRWSVPSGRTLSTPPERLAVTPPPAQLDLPVWIAGDASPLAPSLALPRLASELAPVTEEKRAAAVLVDLHMDIDRDREIVTRVERQEVPFLIARLPDGTARDLVARHVARYLVPEAVGPGFPRIVAESPWPARWPQTEEDLP
jgi:alkanesulfonate monooxygenase SsuD/methylene tetrahydromethanopterin reductase-like flavin-dependent oxidoreductase (luciferase family)